MKALRSFETAVAISVSTQRDIGLESSTALLREFQIPHNLWSLFLLLLLLSLTSLCETEEMNTGFDGDI
jgi:hypothetical protein